MDRNIELIQKGSGSSRWHWIILEYDNATKTRYNVGCGMEESYIKASEIAKKNTTYYKAMKLDIQLNI